MAITRIKNNQITDATIVASSKLADNSVSAGKLADNLVYGSNLTVTGNLTVQGNSTTLDTINTLIEDPILLLAKDQVGSPVFDIGFVGERGDSDNIAWIWDESASEFASGFTSADASGNVITLSAYADAHVADLKLVNLAPTGNVTTALNVDGTIEAGTSIEAPTLTDGTMSINAGSITGGVAATFSGTVEGGTITDGTMTSTAGVMTGVVSIAASGNVDSGNVNTTLVDATTLTASGTVTGGTLTDGTLSSTAGTITGGVAATFSGSVEGGTITDGTMTSTAGVMTGVVSVAASGNVDSGNVNTTLVDATTVTASGTVTGGTVTDGTLSITAGAITGGVSAVFSGNVSAGNLSTAGALSAAALSATGNVTGGNIVSTGAITDGTYSSTAGVFTGVVSVSASGNVDSGNVNTTLVAATTMTASGTVTGGTVTDGTLSINAGSITGGVAGTFSGNVDSGNVNTVLVKATTVTASGTVTGATLTDGTLSSTAGTITGGVAATFSGSVQGGTLTDGTASINAGAITGATSGSFSTTLTATGNITGGNVTTAGITNSGSVTTEALNGSSPTITATGTDASVTIVPTGTGSVDVSSKKITSLATPTADSDAANKAYVDSIAEGLDIKGSVVVATTAVLPAVTYANGTSGVGATLTADANGAFAAVDGITLATIGQRILVKDQASALENGIYQLSTVGDAGSAFVLTRTTDFDQGSPSGEIPGGFTFVEEGTVNEDNGFVCTTNAPVTMGTTAINFSQFSGAGQITAGAGLAKTGNELSVNVDEVTTTITADAVVVKAGAQFVTPNIGAATGTSLTATGTVEGATLTDGTLSINAGSITGGVAGTFSGNVDSGNVNTTLVKATTVTASGTVTGGTLTDGTLSSTAGTITGGVAATFSGSIEGGTLTDGTMSINAGSITGGVAGTFSGNVTAGNLITAGALSAAALSATGNVTGGNIVSTGAITDGTYSSTAGVFTGVVSVSASGNVDSGNVNTTLVAATTVTASGTVTGGTLTDGTLSSTAGTITGGVAATFSGTVQGGTITDGTMTSTAGVMTGVVSIAASGNVDSGNVNTTLVDATTLTASGTVTGGTLTDGTLSSTAGTITGGVAATFSGNVDSGNVNTVLVDATTVTASGTVTGGTVTDGTLSINAGAITGGVSGDFSANVDSGNVNTGHVAADTVTAGNITINTDSVDSIGTAITLNTNSQDVDVNIENSAGNAYVKADAATSTVVIGENGTQTTDATLKVSGTASMMIPVGSTLQRPATPATGMTRFNTTLDSFEFYDSNSWTTAGADFTVIASETFSGDDTTVAFTLQSTQTTASCIVSINGVLQLPTTAYGVSGTTLTFTEAPATGDTIEVREVTTTSTITLLSNDQQTAIIETVDGAATVEITGNLLPAANVTQNLGSDTKRWNELFLAGTTITLGNVVIKNTGGNAIGFFGPDGTTPGVIDDAVGIVGDSIQSGSSIVDFAGSGGNVQLTAGGVVAFKATADGANITGNLTASGNIAATYFIGDGGQLTGIDATVIQNGTTNVSTAANADVTITRGGTLTATVGVTGITMNNGAFIGALTGTASAATLAADATKLATTRAIEVSGAVTGTANFDGSAAINIVTTATSDPTITLGGDLTGSVTLTNLASGTLTATIAANSVALGTDTTGSYVAQGATSGTGLSGSVNTETGTFTVTSNATNLNTASTIVARDASGNFSAGTITAALTGTASAATLAADATKLATTRAIQVSGAVTGTANFDGSAAINIVTTNTADPTITLGGDLTGSVTLTNLASGTLTATIAANSVALGTDTTGNYVGAGAVSGTGLSGSLAAEGGTFTVTSNATNANTASTIVARDGSGDFSAGVITATATAARYADLAEMYAADADIEAGTVVHFVGEGKVAACDAVNCRSVAGIISTDPAHLMNVDQAGVALALAGRVPTKVSGAVKAGDLMVSAGNGRAMANNEASIGTVIGKALEDHEGGDGVIEVLALMM